LAVQLLGNDLHRGNRRRRCGASRRFSMRSRNDVVEAAIAFASSMMNAAPLSIAGSKAQLNAISADKSAENIPEFDAR